MNNFTQYLDKIKDLGIGIEFSKLEAFSTRGDIRPPYAYQWVATSNIIPGMDDPFQGIGGTPIEAIRELYKDCKTVLLPTQDIEEDL